MAESTDSMEFLMTVVQWKVKNFFDLPVKVDYSVESPYFSFANTKWFLQIFTNGEMVKNSSGWIGLYLCNDEAIRTECSIALKLKIIKMDGSPLKAYVTEDTLKNYVFGVSVWGEPKFIKRAELLKVKDAVTLDCALTVLCSVRIVNGSIASLTTQAAPHILSSVVKSVEAASQTADGTSTLIENFKDLYISKRNADIKIIVKGRELLAHKSVLSARCTVFASMFNSDMAEKNSGIIEITDCDPDSFENFLLFLYTGQLDIVSPSNATTLYEISDKYDLKELKEECIRCMINELTVDSLCDVFQIAVTYNDIDILEVSTNFFLENAKHILVTLKWQKFSKENHTLGNELFLKYVNKYPKE